MFPVVTKQLVVLSSPDVSSRTCWYSLRGKDERLTNKWWVPPQIWQLRNYETGRKQAEFRAEICCFGLA
jgi:hypothetical protein